MLQITEELVEKLRNKDEEAFQKIYNAYVKLIYHIAYSYTYNKEDAEDIVSEVFMKVMHSIHSYQENGKFKEWISMITRNVSLNFITRDKNKDIFKDDERIQREKCNHSSNNEMIMMFEEFLDKDTTSIMILRFIYNYKFKDIKSEFISMKQFDNIKIQTSEFDDVRKITEVIDEIVGNYTKNINIDTNKFLTYSYSCIDQEHWNKNKSFENIRHQFYKYTNVLPSNYNLNVEFSENDKKVDIIDKWEYIKYGFSSQATTLFTSGVDTFNYTKLPFLYEKVYIYMYILQLYKKIYIQKLIEKYKSATKASKLRKEFLNFTHNIWLQDITTDDIGQLLVNSWSENLELEKLYWKLKNEYDILYKESNIEKTAKSNKVIMVILITSLILNIINFVVLLN